jgi:hypothetical protein
MTSDPAAARAEAEFDAACARLALQVPADLKGGVVRGYEGLRAMALLLRSLPTEEARPYEDARPEATP